MKRYWHFLKVHFLRGDIAQRLIYINVGVFLLRHILGTLSFLMGFDKSTFYEYFALESSFWKLLQKPWSIISYGFLHADFVHLIINMLVFFFVGRLFLEYLTQKQLLSFYLWGTFLGGCVYVLSYECLPAFSLYNNRLLGASSGVMAIFVGIATYQPHTPVKIPLLGFVKIWALAVIFVGFDFIQIPIENAGGHLAHLGGATFGFLAIKYPSIKINISIKKKLRGKKNKKILNKIKKSGYESLSKEEKKFLFKQGRK